MMLEEIVKEKATIEASDNTFTDANILKIADKYIAFTFEEYGETVFKLYPWNKIEYIEIKVK